MAIKITANEDIASGDLLKVSSGKSLSVEKIKNTDDSLIPIIGIAENSAKQNELVVVVGMVILQIPLSENVIIGDYMKRSSTKDGHMEKTDSANAIAQMLENGSIGETKFGCLKIK